MMDVTWQAAATTHELPVAPMTIIEWHEHVHEPSWLSAPSLM
jgi:hypothetical protein